MDGVYQHVPGKLSRWGVVDVGLKCMHSCVFCYNSFLNGEEDQFVGMRHAQFLPREHVLGLVDALAANGFLGFDVTGGEPPLHPDIVEMVRRAERLGLAVRIITLGQYLMRQMKSAPSHERLIDGLLEAGIADFLLSVHAVDEARFGKITGGSWAKLRAAMEHLDAIGFDYCTNTTVFADNFRDLPAIAREITQHRVYVANLIVMNAYYAWSRPSGAAEKVQGYYGEIHPYLIDARDILEDAGIAVNIRYAPLCTVRGAERNLVGITGVRHDPHEWMNAIDHMRPQPASVMGRRLPLGDYDAGAPLEAASAALEGVRAVRGSKVFPEKCRDCQAIAVCDGLDRRYFDARGDAELSPYGEFRGDLLDRERLEYLPAFVVKTAPFADARGVTQSLLRAA